MAARFIALIPAYKPDSKILKVISDLGKEGMDVVIVDDGSGMEYSEIFEQVYKCLPDNSEQSIVLLVHETNKGKGAALRTGLDHICNFMTERPDWSEKAMKEKDTVVVTLDADGQHLASDALKAARAAAARPGTLVLGSRSFGRDHREDDRLCEIEGGEAEGTPVRSIIGNTVTRGVFRIATGVYVSDTQTGLRAFTADMIPSLLAVRGDRYEYEMNMLLELAGNGTEIIEGPAEAVYLDGNRSSQFGTVKDSFRIYKGIGRYIVSKWSRTLRRMIRFSASSAVSFLIDYSLYALLLTIGAGLVAANIGARVISASANYALNRRYVFKSGNSLVRSAAQYAALAVMILTGNTIMLTTLAGAGIGSMAAKVITEITFFMISWLVQQYVIFYREPEQKSAEDQAEENADHGSRHFTIGYAAVRPKRLREAYRKNIG